MKYLIFYFCVYTLPQLHTAWFEGKIVYSISTVDRNNVALNSPILLQEVYYSSTKKITRVLSGDFKQLVGDYFLCIDIEKKKRMEVWLESGRIVGLGNESKKNAFFEIRKTLVKEIIKDYPCSLYKIKRKYQHQLDTTYIDLYASDEWQIHSDQIVEIIGNSSSDNLDGSITGLPLKIIIQDSNGIFRQEVVEVKRGKISEFLKNYLGSLNSIRGTPPQHSQTIEINKIKYL